MKPSLSCCKNIQIKIYRSIILHFVLYGSETWSLALWEEHRMFENRMLRMIFGRQTEEVT
jgi:hypothetical protein